MMMAGWLSHLLVECHIATRTVAGRKRFECLESAKF